MKRLAAAALGCLLFLSACREAPPFPEPESWTEVRVTARAVSYTPLLPADMWQELWAYLKGAERHSGAAPEDGLSAPLTIRIAHTGSKEVLLLDCLAGDDCCLLEEPGSGTLWETDPALYEFLAESFTAS